jgi:hypothetical protein
MDASTRDTAVVVALALVVRIATINVGLPNPVAIVAIFDVVSAIVGASSYIVVAVAVAYVDFADDDVALPIDAHLLKRMRSVCGYVYVCVCACTCMYVCVCMCACVCVRERKIARYIDR